MTLLSFPDINVWLALATPEHALAPNARRWWELEGGNIAFCRFSQMGLLRLVTTAAAMDSRPLTMAEAWKLYDRFFVDDRVLFVPEERNTESIFRKKTTGQAASPKLWADAWLLATADAAGGRLITFDKALASRGATCL